MKVSSYQDAIQYLEQFIKPTVFRRIEVEEAAKKNPLDRMRKLLELLGNPQEKFKSIQVSGTSGKSSTAYFISHILTTAGYKTGFTFSPHLQEVTERIVINDKKISETEFIELVNTVQPAIAHMEEEPSYFEILMAMAFIYFAQEKVDIAVVEVGIEGKYDASNVLGPLIAVLTNIDLDHTEFLGSTTEEIAKEAVSIIHENQIVITGAKQPSVFSIIEEKCEEAGGELYQLGKDFNVILKSETSEGMIFDFENHEVDFEDIMLSMIGGYQAENAGIAIETVLKLSKFEFKISEEHIRTALKTAFFPGRFERIEWQMANGKWQIVLDGAHNPAKMQAFLHSLKKIYPTQGKTFVLAFKEDKDINSMLTQISEIADVIVFTEFHSSIGYVGGKAISIQNSKFKIQNYSSKIKIYYESDSEKAVKKAIELAQNSKDIIVVTGSLYLIGEVRSLLSA